ncbi:MAG: Uma2 family endonuclease [Gemmataceae bacterium]
MYSYPDVVVYCGEPEFLDANGDVLVNPVAVFEVLSPSTEAFDRGGKFNRFQTHNPTLTDYVLVSQDEPLVEHFHRQDDGSWTYRRAVGLKSKLTVATIGVTLKLADVYERVTFE